MRCFSLRRRFRNEHFVGTASRDNTPVLRPRQTLRWRFHDADYYLEEVAFVFLDNLGYGLEIAERASVPNLSSQDGDLAKPVRVADGEHALAKVDELVHVAFSGCCVKLGDLASAPLTITRDQILNVSGDVRSEIHVNVVRMA